MGFEQQVATVVGCNNHLSLPFCKFELQLIFSIISSMEENKVESVSSALLASIKMAVENDEPCWADLISGLEPRFINKV